MKLSKREVERQRKATMQHQKSVDGVISDAALDSYKRYSAKFLRQRLKEKMYLPVVLICFIEVLMFTVHLFRRWHFVRIHREKVTPSCTQVFGSVLFADISGFTQLSSRLSAEDLKTHIK